MTTTSTGYGQTRKTRKSAQREADAWTASGHGNSYTNAAGLTETIVTEVQEVEGGFACAYLTTRTTHEES